MGRSSTLHARVWSEVSRGKCAHQPSPGPTNWAPTAVYSRALREAMAVPSLQGLTSVRSEVLVSYRDNCGSGLDGG